MQFPHVCIGLRFTKEEDAFPALFQALCIEDLQGLGFYGGRDRETEPEAEAFVLVIGGGKLSRMRKLFQKLSEDPELESRLCLYRPYLQCNALEHLSGDFRFYGKIDADGSLRDGEGELPFRAQREIPKKESGKEKRRILLLASDLGAACPADMLLKSLRRILRKRFSGEGIRCIPIFGEESLYLRSLLTACEGSWRSISIADETGTKLQARYGILWGKRGILEGSRGQVVAEALVERGRLEGLSDLWILGEAMEGTKALNSRKALLSAMDFPAQTERAELVLLAGADELLKEAETMSVKAPLRIVGESPEALEAELEKILFSL